MALDDLWVYVGLDLKEIYNISNPNILNKAQYSRSMKIKSAEN